MSQQITLQQLESFLWDAAVILRGTVDASEFKEYIFGALFLKRISDAFDEAQENLIAHFISVGKTPTQAHLLAEDEREYAATFYIPPAARWGALKDLKLNLGVQLNAATCAIEACNASLVGVLTSIDFNVKNKLSDKKLGDLLQHFSCYRLRNQDFEHPDLLGTAYEYLIKMFADSAGKKGGEFYTPSEVVSLLVALLKPQAGMRIYDPTVGSGGMLIQTHHYLAKQGVSTPNLALFGQESNLTTWAICKMNLFLHGFYTADIRKGDTLGDPKHLQGGQLMTFDQVIANPPFGLKSWGKEAADADCLGRFPYGTPPKDSGDLAFLQHMLASLHAEGRLGVVMSHGVLFRGASEKSIRQGILDDDLIEAVIGLPAALFYGTNIPACLLIINKNKPAERKRQVLFINGELEYEEGKNQNKLHLAARKKIVSTFDNYTEIERYSKIYSLESIANNDYNLTIRRYVDTRPPLETFDVNALLLGGVPVEEVESDYMRTVVLKGFDVGCVFDRQDLDYYQFKKSIASKEHIAVLLSDETPAVIYQIEHWWDKYRVSLQTLDQQLAAAEQALQAHLQGLGYG